MAEADPKIQKAVSAPLKPAFAVKLDAFLRVKPFVSTEETRYYLNGVYVHPCPEGGVLCVATDGHRLGVRRDKMGICHEPTIVRVPKELKLPGKSLFPNMPWLVCMSNGSKGHLSLVEAELKSVDDVAEAAIARVDDCIIRFGAAVIDGTFPDYSRAVPKRVEGKTIGLNGDYLKSFGRNLSLNGESSSSPFLVRDEQDRDFLGVVMPMRVGDDKVPSWLGRPA